MLDEVWLHGAVAQMRQPFLSHLHRRDLFRYSAQRSFIKVNNILIILGINVAIKGRIYYNNVNLRGKLCGREFFMKRLLAALLTSCMIIGLMSPAGSGLMTQITANAAAGATNISSTDDTSITEVGETAAINSPEDSNTETAEAAASNSFDESISALYDQSMEITDEEILAAAELMNSDFGAVEDAVTYDAEGLVAAVKSYEASKSLYMTDADRANPVETADAVEAADATTIAAAADAVGTVDAAEEDSTEGNTEQIVEEAVEDVSQSLLMFPRNTEMKIGIAVPSAASDSEDIAADIANAAETLLRTVKVENTVTAASDSAETIVAAPDSEDAIAQTVDTESDSVSILGIASDDMVSAQIEDEWKKQEEYTSYVIPANNLVESVVPRVKITSCTYSEENGERTATLGVYEWATIGYKASEEDVLNASAYGYEYSIKLVRQESGWKIANVGDSEQNFDWMDEEAAYAAEQEALLSGSAGDSSDENGSQDADSEDAPPVTSEDGQKSIMAASNTATTSYSYNRTAAIAYADKYCKSYNKSYNSYKGKGGDCANFVSQCLFAGGMPTDSVWYKHSVAWINCTAQIAHFKSFGTFLSANNDNILAGNPIWFDWNGDGTYDHATICVGRNSSGVAILDSHTSDLYHSTWNHWSFKKAATIQLRDSGTAAGTSTSSSTAASTGSWQKDSKGSMYKNADGSYVKNSFKVIDGKTYYFDANGYMVKGWVKTDGKWYFMNTSTGEMMTGWITVNKKLYYMQSNGVAYMSCWQTLDGKKYYFNSECVAVTGLATIGGKTYYFDSKGAMQTGWVTIGSNKYYCGSDGTVAIGWRIIDSRRYYFSSGGIMQTGKVSVDGQGYDFGKDGAMAALIDAGTCKVKLVSTTASGSGTASNSDTSTAWVKVGSGWMYYKNGKAATGWQQLGGKWYYLDSKGKMLTGLQKINGKTYYLASSGVMQTGWHKVSGKWYYFQSNGVMKTGWLKISGKWYYLGSSGRMHTGWQKVSGKKYYFQSNGVMKIGWQKVSGKWYYLQSNGVMKTGWLTLGSKKYYLHSNGVMSTGLTTISGGKYYFNSSGVMQTGWVTVDGKKYFFSPARNGRCATGDWDINGKIYHFDSSGVLKR